MFYSNNNYIGRLKHGIDEDSLACYTSQRLNFSVWNESRTIGFGIPDSLELTYIVNYCLGVILVIIGLAGSAGNGLVLYVFTRYKRLRGGGGPLILSLASGDFAVSILHILPAISSFYNKWAFGNVGCNLYAGSVGLCGIASLLTLSAIAADKFSVIIGRPLAWLAEAKTCVAIWLVSASLTVPPLFGWSRYCLEGLGTSCSWDYKSRDFHNRLYYIFLLTAGFLLPVTIITTSYLGILWVVCKQKSQLQMIHKDTTSDSMKKPTNNDIKTAQTIQLLGECITPPKGSLDTPLTFMAFFMNDTQATGMRSYYVSSHQPSIAVICTIIILFLVAWTPYAIVSLIGQFGDESKPLSPMATALPAIFAKTSVIINPIVYGLSHPHFRSAVRTLHARGFGGKKYRNQPNPNNKAYYQYHYNQSKYGSRYTSATKLRDLYNGTRHGSGERMRRETSRQREMWKQQYSLSTRMMSDMTTTCQHNRSSTNKRFVPQDTSLLRKHLTFLENAEQVRVQEIEITSIYCTEKSSSPELHGIGKTTESITSSATPPTLTKKYFQNGRIVFEGKKRGKGDASFQGREQLHKPLSRSENYLDLAQTIVGHSSSKCSKSLSICERSSSRVTFSKNNPENDPMNIQYRKKVVHTQQASRSVSFNNDDHLRENLNRDEDKSRKTSCSHFTPKRIAYKRKLLHLRGMMSRIHQSQNKWNAFGFNKEELSKTKTGFSQVSLWERPASACLYESYEHKKGAHFVLHKSGEIDPMSVFYLRNTERKSKSTLGSWRHKMENSPLAKKIFWRLHEKQAAYVSNNSSEASYGGYLSTSNHILDYCSSFI